MRTDWRGHNLAILLLLSCGLAGLAAPGPARAQESGRTTVVVFPIRGDKDLSESVLQAIKADLRQGGSILVVEFQSDLPTLKRAVLEQRITSSDLKSPVTPDAQDRVARALDADYYMDGSVTKQRQGISLKTSVTQTGSDRHYGFNAEARPSGSNSSVGQDSLILSVANTVVSQFMTQVLGLVPPAAPAIPDLPKPAVTSSSTQTAPTPPPAQAQPGTPTTTPAAPAAAQPSAPSAAPEQPAASTPSAAAYSAQADTLAASGDLAGAIEALRQAVNLSPNDPSLRLKLSDMYTRKGMTNAAANELQRAVALAPANASSREDLAKQFEAAGSLDEARKLYEEILKDNPKDIHARLALGDVLWNMGKTDDAALEYAQAANDDPKNPDPQDRLARLYASRGQFPEALASVNTAKSLRQESADSPVALDLYKSLIQSADVAYHKDKDQLDTLAKSFAAGTITREQYYNKVKPLLTDVEGLADFLSDINPPADYANAHLHRTLAASLLAQSVTSLQDWLIKNQDNLKSDYERFARDSATEMDTANQIEAKLHTAG